MSFHLVQKNSASQGNSSSPLVVSLPGVTVGNVLCVSVVVASGVTISLTDGTTVFTPAVTQTVSIDTLNTYAWQVVNGGNITLTLSTGASAAATSLTWAEFSADVGSTITVSAVASGTGSSTSTGATSSLANVVGDLIYCSGQQRNVTVSLPGSGYTVGNFVASGGGIAGVADEYLLKSLTTPLTPGWTVSNVASVWMINAISLTSTGGTPDVVMHPYIDKTGSTLVVQLANAANTAPIFPTAVNSNPTVTINGTPTTLSSFAWTDTTRDCPWVIWLLPSILGATDVVTWTAPSGMISTSSDPTEAISVAASVANYFGQDEPGFGGQPGFAPRRTMPLGVDMSAGPFTQFSGGSHAANLMRKASAFAGVSGGTVTFDLTDTTLPSTFAGQIAATIWDTTGTSNGIETASGQINFPTPQGKYAIRFVDINASSATLQAKVILTGAANADQTTVDVRGTTPPNDTTKGITRLVAADGVTTTIVYPDVKWNTTMGHGLANGYNMRLGVTVSGGTGNFSRLGTITNFQVFGPGDTENPDLSNPNDPYHAIAADPLRISGSLRQILTADNGNGPAVIRVMQSVGASTGLNNFQDYVDCTKLNTFSWSVSAAKPNCTLSAIRFYNTDQSKDNVTGDGTYPWQASNKVYDSLIGILTTTDGTTGTDSYGPYIDLSKHGGSGDNGEYMDRFAGSANNDFAIMEFVTTARHQYRSGDLIPFPTIGSGQFRYIPVTGSNLSALSGTATANNGSGVVAFTAAPTLAVSSAIAFRATDGDSTGQAYLVTATIPGTVTLTASATITFSQAQTLATGQQLKFGADTTGTPYTIQTGQTAATAYTLTASYTGITSTTSTASIFGISMARSPLTITPVYGGSNTSTAVVTPTAFVDLNVAIPNLHVTSETSFALAYLCGGVNNGGTAYKQVNWAVTGVKSLPASFQIGQFEEGSAGPYGFYANMVANWPGCKLWIPIMPYMSVACLQAIVAEMAPYLLENSVVVCEHGLEHWNTNQFQTGYIDAAWGRLLKYLPPGTTVTTDMNGNPRYTTPASGGVALNPDAAYTLLSSAQHDILQAAFDAFGKGIKVERMIGSQAGNPGVTVPMITFASTLGSPSAGGLQSVIPIDNICIAPYDGVPTNNATWKTACSPSGGAWQGQNAMHSFAKHYMAQNTTNQAQYPAMRAAIAPYAGSPLPGLVMYESQFTSVDPLVGIADNHDCFYAPPMADSFRANYQAYQDGKQGVGGGVNYGCIFNIGWLWGSNSQLSQIWAIQVWAGQAGGNGSSNLYTVAKNGGDGFCHDAQNVSVEIPAMQAWFADANTPPAPSAGFVVLEASVLPEQSSPITLHLIGTGTSWTSGSAVSIQNSVTGTTTVTAGAWNATSTTSATLAVTTGAGSGTFTITVDTVVSPSLTVVPPTFSVLPSKIPANQSNPIELTLIGAGTGWTSGSTVTIQNSVTGTTHVNKGTFTDISVSAATLTVTTGAGTGTWTITIDGVVSGTLAVGPRNRKWFPGMGRVARVARFG